MLARIDDETRAVPMDSAIDGYRECDPPVVSARLGTEAPEGHFRNGRVHHNGRSGSRQWTHTGESDRRPGCERVLYLHAEEHARHRRASAGTPANHAALVRSPIEQPALFPKTRRGFPRRLGRMALVSPHSERSPVPTRYNDWSASLRL